ncbi:MAG: hypothetical protein LBV34_21685 [Nocardiopsaceae bacterium]|nr:hypothetical protein [Nocardiopsaceae bacterium]
MYLITRADLPPGIQACQAAHAAFNFAIRYPDLTSDWHTASNTLVLLAVPDELTLSRRCQDARIAGFRMVSVQEPDLDNSLTAAAIEPAAARLVRRLPLALASQEAAMSSAPSVGPHQLGLISWASSAGLHQLGLIGGASSRRPHQLITGRGGENDDHDEITGRPSGRPG